MPVYAIKVLLQSPYDARTTGARSSADIGERILVDPQPGIAHVSLVPLSSQVVAMTFVVAADLGAAERLAAEAWDTWLGREWSADWKMSSCGADLLLGVWAAAEPFVQETGLK
ncbi:hypothetical protein VR44_16450 [Streptomyces katrae]|uniref:Uncharacterized protein n=1 Tax=Streptomyces katrae TaxID=68223 RepID=A0A0F4JGS0_9ACTN|nr:hypothetical protein VR44_16450 [Streptomyces katrae]